MKKVLVVAPHPDDETIGCGGTLLKHRENKDKIYWLIVTKAGKEFGWTKERIQQRNKEIEEVASLYGFHETIKLAFDTTRLDTIPLSQLIREISGVITSVQPEVVYLPNRTDVHSDHTVVFDAAWACTKSFRYPSIKRILSYETMSETEFGPPLTGRTFVPNVFVDITKQFKKKKEILMVFESELMKPPYPRSIAAIENLAGYRGSRIGCKYAEAFSLLYESIS